MPLSLFAGTHTATAVILPLVRREARRYHDLVRRSRIGVRMEK
jgi:hypothetical protein